MKKIIWDGALLISLMMALSISLTMNVMAESIRPELAFGANTVALEGTLDSVRGKGNEDQTIDRLLSATMGNNSASNVNSSASNYILDNAFVGASGFTTVIQNAADNVIIQSTTSLTVNFNP